tara:strand:+ start:38 stop:667 length:630 start_codon:yes stop_codon:yes gene_type:complete
MGTSCAYGADNLALFESTYMDGEPEDGLYTYAYTKRMLYTGLQAVHKQFGLDYRYLIPSTLYGPGFEEGDRHFIFDLIRKIYNGYHYGDTVTLWGDGSQVRELIYIDDAIKLMGAYMSQDEVKIANMTSSTFGSIQHFAEHICAQIGFDPSDIKYDTSRYVGNRKRILHHAQSQAILGTDYVQKLELTSLVDGLEETIKYYHEHFGNRR